MKKLLPLLVMLIFMTTSSHAFAGTSNHALEDTFKTCYKSTAPVCVQTSASTKFKNDEMYNSCKKQLEAYISDMEKWQLCVIQRANSQAEEEVNNAIRLFNCKVKNDSICY